MKDVLILAIESSCDETAVAIIKNGNEVVSNIVSSQINVHKKFGGVIPEVASRLHIENISVVYQEAMEKANLTMDDIDAIAITQGPGLIGSLHVGVQAAKTLAWAFEKPLIAVHHIAGHIYANNLVSKLQFPTLALVVSGGHTELVLMQDDLNFEIIGTTQDDAVGEAYDKVARTLNLPYPGGPQIDRLAKEGEPQYHLPKPMNDKSYNFSYSGLKSAVINLVHNSQQRHETVNTANVAYAFQEAALSVLIDKMTNVLNNHKIKQVVLAGGVAANSRLRELITNKINNDFPQIDLIIPPLWCCTDNAAMIGAAAYAYYCQSKFADLSLSADPSLELS